VKQGILASFWNENPTPISPEITKNVMDLANYLTLKQKGVNWKVTVGKSGENWCGILFVSAGCHASSLFLTRPYVIL